MGSGFFGEVRKKVHPFCISEDKEGGYYET